MDQKPAVVDEQNAAAMGQSRIACVFKHGRCQAVLLDPENVARLAIGVLVVERQRLMHPGAAKPFAPSAVILRIAAVHVAAGVSHQVSAAHAPGKKELRKGKILHIRRHLVAKRRGRIAILPGVAELRDREIGEALHGIDVHHLQQSSIKLRRQPICVAVLPKQGVSLCELARAHHVIAKSCRDDPPDSTCW